MKNEYSNRYSQWILSVFISLGGLHSARAMTVSCLSSEVSVAILPLEVAGSYTLSVEIIRGQRATYQRQSCSFNALSGQLSAVVCGGSTGEVSTAFVLERNGATFDLKQEVGVQGKAAEFLLPMNLTIARGLSCSILGD